MVAKGSLLQRPSGHQLQIYTTGAEGALPVLLLHGGPGGGAKPADSQYFDLASVRLIQFDQRGTGQSRFNNAFDDNTTQNQIADIEAIRVSLGIESWAVVGGSWGALLAVLYAETHPQVVRSLVLRSVFLDRKSDRDWLLREGGPAPKSRQRLIELIGTSEGVFGAIDRQLADVSNRTAKELGAAWSHYERVLSGLSDDAKDPLVLSSRQHLDVRLEMHYLARGFFVAENQSANEATKLCEIPGIIIQGVNDGIIAPDSALHLSNKWGRAEVRQIPKARHSTQCEVMRLAWQDALSEITSSKMDGLLS